VFGISLEGAPWQVLLLVLLLLVSWSAFAWLGRTLLNAWFTGQFLHIRGHNERVETLKEVITDQKNTIHELRKINATLLNLSRGVTQTAQEATVALAENVATATRERRP
jgi:hypothetical protein